MCAAAARRPAHPLPRRRRPSRSAAGAAPPSRCRRLRPRRWPHLLARHRRPQPAFDQRARAKAMMLLRTRLRLRARLRQSAWARCQNAWARCHRCRCRRRPPRRRRAARTAPAPPAWAAPSAPPGPPLAPSPAQEAKTQTLPPVTRHASMRRACCRRQGDPGCAHHGVAGRDGAVAFASPGACQAAAQRDPTSAPRSPRRATARGPRGTHARIQAIITATSMSIPPNVPSASPAGPEAAAARR
jgi:hypothetical protein